MSSISMTGRVRYSGPMEDKPLINTISSRKLVTVCRLGGMIVGKHWQPVMQTFQLQLSTSLRISDSCGQFSTDTTLIL